MLTQNKILTTSGRLSPSTNKILKSNPVLRALIVEVTDFLQYDAPIITRLQCILQNINEQPTCGVCGDPLRMATSGPRVNSFPVFCGLRCASKHKDVKKKRRNTNKRKYGVENVLACAEIQEKLKNTNMKKYGVDNPLKNEEVRQKIKETNLSRYGVENPLDNEKIRIKGIMSNLQKFGVDNPLKNEEVRQRIKETNLSRYGVENPFSLKETQVKAKETMVKRYGVPHARQSEEIRKRIDATMQDKFGSPYFWRSKISEDTLRKIEDKDWFYQTAVIEQLPGYLIAERLGVSKSMVYVYAKKHQVELPHTADSFPERQLRDFVERCGVKFVNNDRQLIYPKEIDIIIPEKKLAIELNGVFWHSELNGKGRFYHYQKTQMMQSKGYQLIHILDTEWNNNTLLVQSRLKNLFGQSERIYARKCIIKEVPSKEKRNFFSNNHMQGDCPSSLAIGLYFNDQLVSCMSFGRPRFTKSNKIGVYELLRFSNVQGSTVIGGASRLFAWFKDLIRPLQVISYSDKRWNTGSLYTKLGFEYKRTSSPNYFYFKPDNTDVLYSRNKFQKHKLKDRLETFDASLSEWKNMQLNGYDRIWDCGNDVYVWSRT
jgi:G:T-mismatch repair DNA endonuclease (very short patch repair protein)